MHRGQATVEHALLSLALLLVTCLLVRFATPVEDLGRAVARALAPDRERAAPVPRARPARAAASRPRPGREPRCYCPTDPRYVRPPVPP